ncbi:MAG: alpha/beta fold hydrolase [Dehalococcoidales bacterium]|nr:alpha/beta fold hydrolase [Dehalococcoidales bacterium]
MIRNQSVVMVDNIPIVGELHVPRPEGKYPTVCLCHGIPSGEPPSPDDGGYPDLAARLCEQGFAAYWFNFRGAGGSGGNLDLAGWVRDLKASINYLCRQDVFDGKTLWLIGFSAGAAVSIYTAAGDGRVSGVIACACPAEIFPPNPEQSWQAFADHLRNIGAIRDAGFPPSVEEWGESFRKLSPIEFVSQLAPRPLLLIHGDRDDIVPVTHARRLYEKAGNPKELIIVEGAGHRLRRERRVLQHISTWLKDNIRR